MKGIKLIQTFLMHKSKYFSIELLHSLVILWYFYSMVGLQNGYFFTLFEMLVVFLDQSLIKSLHLHLSLLILPFDRMMGDWWRSIIGSFIL